MRYLLLIIVLGWSTLLKAQQYNALVLTMKGDSIWSEVCLADGFLPGNIKALSYQVNDSMGLIALSEIECVKVAESEYHVLNIYEQAEEFFDEEVILEHRVLAKLEQSGDVSLYHYYHTKHNMYRKDLLAETSSEQMHKKMILCNGDTSLVVYKLNYKASLKRLVANSTNH